jgi:flagellar FliL protein
MATKDKEAEADGENAEGQGAGAPKKGLARFLTKKILIIAAPVLLLLLGGIGGGVYFLFLKPAPVKVAKADAIPLTPPQVAFSDVPDILVNIQSSDGTPAYLKLSLSLEMDNDLEKAGITALTPRLVDQFQSYLRELRVDDLKGSEGVLRLKEELLRRVNASSAPYHVRDVLLKQMIVQ